MKGEWKKMVSEYRVRRSEIDLSFIRIDSIGIDPEKCLELESAFPSLPGAMFFLMGRWSAVSSSEAGVQKDSLPGRGSF
jgi:hypothetical protein